jgi:branched-chain amino acid transport system ATP-binding protein
MPLLQAKDLQTYYGPVQVLHGVSIDVQPGQVTAVLGRNGMGKTTLVHTIMGLLHPRRGTIELDGDSIRGLAPERVYAKGLTMMPQGHRVFGSLTVGENLTVAYRRSKNSNGWPVDEVLEYFPRMSERWKQPASTLSGGEQQMLTMARTLVGNGRYVMLDEPAEGLAPAITEVFAEIIRELRRRGAGVLLVEQRFEFAMALADVVYVMSRGVEVFAGVPGELRVDEAIKETYLGLGRAT